MSTSAVASDFPYLDAAVETSNSNDNGAVGAMNRGASYFFGFLVTFVILFFLFVGCGLASRRRLVARRRARLAGGVGEVDSWGSDWLGNEGLRTTKPVWEEKWVDVNTARSATSWAGMTPLAMTIVSPNAESTMNVTKAKRSEESSTALLHTSPTSSHFFSSNSWILPTSRKRNAVPDSTKESVSPPLLSALQSEALVTVMIFMPRTQPPEQPPEYQLGVARVLVEGKVP